MEKFFCKLTSTSRCRRSGRRVVRLHLRLDDTSTSESSDEDTCAFYSPPRRRQSKARKCCGSNCQRKSTAPKQQPRPRKVPTPKAKPPPRPSGLMVDLSDDEQSVSPQAELVRNRVDSFFKSNKLLSDDEDDVIALPQTVKSEKPKPPVKYTVDSDDEVVCVDSNLPKKSSVDVVSSVNSSDLCMPSTSTAGPSYLSTTVPKISTSTSSVINEKLNQESSGKNKEDDIMAFVDSILLDEDVDKKTNDIADLRSLEDFRKETEEMLKNVSTMIDNFKGVKPNEPKTETPKEPPVVPQDKNETPTKKGLGSCPICLEPMIQNVCSTTCGHIFCKACITYVAKTQKKCPTCRKRLGPKNIHPLYVGA